MSNLILGGVIGLLLGLAWCYWRQINAVYQNKDLLISGSNLATDAQTFIGNLRKL
jgi:hypothetical protein